MVSPRAHDKRHMFPINAFNKGTTENHVKLYGKDEENTKTATTTALLL
jgi:hypothetical protein